MIQQLLADSTMSFLFPNRMKTDVIDVDQVDLNTGGDEPVALKQQEPADRSDPGMASDHDEVQLRQRSASGAQLRSLTPSPARLSSGKAAANAPQTPSGSSPNPLAQYTTPSTDRRLSFVSAAPEPDPLEVHAAASSSAVSQTSLLPPVDGPHVPPPAPSPPRAAGPLGMAQLPLPAHLFSPVQTDKLPPLARSATLLPTRPCASQEAPEARMTTPPASRPSAMGQPQLVLFPGQAVGATPPFDVPSSRAAGVTAFPCASSPSFPWPLPPPFPIPFTFCAESFLNRSVNNDNPEVCGESVCVGSWMLVEGGGVVGCEFVPAVCWEGFCGGTPCVRSVCAGTVCVRVCRVGDTSFFFILSGGVYLGAWGS